MAGIEVEVVINGPQEKVFDVVTIAGLWPQWAVLARAVAGVTERPFHLGDPIYEFVRTPIGPQEVEWHITEHDRPHHAKLQAEDGTTITYTFIGKGDDTSFRRVFELGSVLGAQQPPPYTSDTARAEKGAGGEDPLARAEGPQPAIRRAVHGVGWASVMVVRCLGRRIAPRQRIVAEAVPAPGSLGLTAAPDDVRLMFVLRRLDPWCGILVCAAAG